MTKSDLTDAVLERLGGRTTRKAAADLVEVVFDEIKAVLATGKNLKISGFGNFIVRDKAERWGRNPRTGEPMTIAARRVVAFKTSSVLKAIMNEHS